MKTSIDPTVSARLDEGRCELHYSCGGLWSVETIDDLFDTLNRTCAPLVKAKKPIYSIADFSAAIPQDRETAEKIGAYLRSATEFGLKRTAVVSAPALMKLQYQRVASGIEIEFFDSKGDALAWLRADRAKAA